MAKRRILLPAAVLLAALGVLATVTLSRAGEDARPQANPVEQEVAPEAAPAGATPTVRGPRIPPLDDRLTRGSKKPDVLIVEFGDFGCHGCREFARKVEPELVKKYVQTGKVRIGWRDFPAQGKASMRAAVAARAAGRQDRFWDYHDALFEAGSGFSDDFLRQTAARLGLDISRFDRDRQDPDVRKAVEEDFGFAQQLGLAGTPAFLINGRPFFGSQPLKAFEEAINKAA